MKAHADTMFPNLPLEGGGQTFVNKGTNGRWRDILTVEDNRLYEAVLLERLGGDRPAQPPTAYRALDFLVAHGFAHRVESLSAFVACAYPGAAHAPAFLICRDCRKVAESATEAGAGRLADAARDAGFTIESAVLEAEGLCPACADARA